MWIFPDSKDTPSINSDLHRFLCWSGHVMIQLQQLYHCHTYTDGSAIERRPLSKHVGCSWSLSKLGLGLRWWLGWGLGVGLGLGFGGGLGLGLGQFK